MTSRRQVTASRRHVTSRHGVTASRHSVTASRQVTSRDGVSTSRRHGAASTSLNIHWLYTHIARDNPKALVRKYLSHCETTFDFNYGHIVQPKTQFESHWFYNQNVPGQPRTRFRRLGTDDVLPRRTLAT